jgi:3-isopropylmalate dehydrogenase
MKICVLPGDGIGPEIMAEAVRVLKALDLKIEMEEALLGGCAVDATGSPYPDATQKLAQAADAVLLGAVGGPQWDNNPREQRPERGLLGIRKQLGLFANLRPAILYPELANASTLKPEVVAGLDILIVRELTGDIYFGQPRGIELREVDGQKQRFGFNTMHYTESEIRRILRVAFDCGTQTQQEGLLGGQDERAGMHPALARRGDRDGQGIPGRRTQPHAGRQCSDAAGEEPQAVRCHGHRQHVR